MEDRARIRRLADGFNLTTFQWEVMDTYQRSLCWFCQKKQKSGKRLATDHRHSDGLIRGLLCSQCNRLLGKIESSGWTPEILATVAEYLDSPPAVTAIGRVFGYPGRVGTKKHRKWVQKKRKAEQNGNN